jgi:hypothetical protein
LKCFLLILTTLTLYCTKSNQDITIVIINIKKASIDAKKKSIIKTRPDINYKINRRLYRLKYSPYDILIVDIMTLNPFCDC